MKRLTLLLFIMALPLALYANGKEKIAVFDPSLGGSKIDEGSAIAVRELINQTVVNTNSYKLVERSFLERVMQEQQFNNSGAVSDSDATRIGELAGADKIVLSVLTPAQDRFLLSIKVIDVESAQIVGQGTSIFAKNQLFEKVEEVAMKALSYNSNKVVKSEPAPETIQQVTPKQAEPKEKVEKTKKPKKKVWLEKTPIYKGFIDLGFTIGNAIGVTATTTHGAQINPHIYVGGGLGICYEMDFNGDIGFPIYADFKVNALKRRISPVLDVRLGYTAGAISGFYTSIMPGCQFYLKNKMGLSLYLGYERLGNVFYEESNYNYYYDWWTKTEITEGIGGVSVKCAFDF